MTTHAAWQHRENSVRRFLPIFKQLCEQPHPRAVSFDPSELGISCETGVSRLRDAANSILNGYTSFPNVVDTTRLRAVWPLFYVHHDGKHVRIVPRAEKESKTTTAAPVSVGLVGERHDVLAVLNATDEHFDKSVHALALLLGLRVLVGSVKIQNGKLPPTLVDDLQTNFDMHFQSNLDHTIMF